jgi:hypothetical protein
MHHTCPRCEHVSTISTSDRSIMPMFNMEGKLQNHVAYCCLECRLMYALGCIHSSSIHPSGYLTGTYASLHSTEVYGMKYHAVVFRKKKDGAFYEVKHKETSSIHIPQGGKIATLLLECNCSPLHYPGGWLGDACNARCRMIHTLCLFLHNTRLPEDVLRRLHAFV